MATSLEKLTWANAAVQGVCHAFGLYFYPAILDPVYSKFAPLEVTMDDVVTLWLSIELPCKVKLSGVEVWKVVIGLCAAIDSLHSVGS